MKYFMFFMIASFALLSNSNAGSLVYGDGDSDYPSYY